MKQATVLAMHDLCGWGSCSLKIALPVLSATGAEVVPFPTALLAAHTGAPAWSFLDVTEELPEFCRVFRELELSFDAVYSGFLGSEKQVGILEGVLEEQAEAFFLFDPVMGDHGKRYASCREGLCAAMRRLLPRADVVTPNLTEAAILLDAPYEGAELSEEKAREMAEGLSSMGARTVILKGRVEDGMIYNGVLHEGEWTELGTRLLPESMHGTGDLFASLLLGALLCGAPPETAVRMAGELVGLALRRSLEIPRHASRGVSFETVIFDYLLRLREEGFYAG